MSVLPIGREIPPRRDGPESSVVEMLDGRGWLVLAVLMCVGIWLSAPGPLMINPLIIAVLAIVAVRIVSAAPARWAPRRGEPIDLVVRLATGPVLLAGGLIYVIARGRWIEAVVIALILLSELVLFGVIVVMAWRRRAQADGERSPASLSR